jgi:hypothetical protein
MDLQAAELQPAELTPEDLDRVSGGIDRGTPSDPQHQQTPQSHGGGGVGHPPTP